MTKIVKKFLSLILAISVALNISSPTTSAAIINQNKKIEQIRKKINNDKKRIESNKNNKKQLEAAKNEMTKNLSQISKNVEELDRKYKECLKQQDERMDKIKNLDGMINKNQQNINELNNQINKIKANSERLQNLILKCLKWTYKHMRNNFIEIFFSAKNYSDITKMTKYMEVYCKYEKKLINEYTSEINKINVIKNAKEKEQNQINAFKDSINKEINLINKNASEINKIQNEKNNYLGILKKNINNIDNKTDEIKAAEKMLNDEINRLNQELEDCTQAIIHNNKKFIEEIKQEKQETTSKGFCFPVASPCRITRGISKNHKGIDISTGGRQSPIYAAQNGVVTFSKFGASGSGFGGYGNCITILHKNEGVTTLYGHLSKITARSGQTVQKGQIIGYAGNTGKSNGIHLHFEVRNNKTGGTLNPLNYISYRSR